MATEIATAIAQDTNSIQDNMTRRAVQRGLNELNEGNYDQKIDGVAFSATALEMDYRAINIRMANVSAAKSVYAISPYTGNIKTFYAVMSGTTLAPTPDVFSFGISAVGAADVALAGNLLTLTTGVTAYTGSSVDTTSGAARALTPGAVIRCSGNGGSTGPAMHGYFTVLIEIT